MVYANFKGIDSKDSNVWVRTNYYNPTPNTFSCSYWGGHVILPEAIFEKARVDLKNVIDNPKKVIGKGKPYISKWCNIPRYKIDDYAKTKNIKRAWSYNDADYVVVDFTEIQKVYKEFFGERVESYKFCYEVEFKDLKPSGNFKNIGHNFVDKNSNFIISNSKLDYGVFKGFEKFLLEGQVGLSVDSNKGRLGLLDILIDYVLNPGKFELVFDSDYINELNSDGLELDEETFSSIEMMFESKDKANIKMAIEILSNTNIKDNIIPVAILFNKYSYHLKGMASKVDGFKVIKSILESENINYTINWQYFINSMIKRYPEGAKYYNKYIYDNLNGFLKYKGAKFTIKIIEVEY